MKISTKISISFLLMTVAVLSISTLISYYYVSNKIKSESEQVLKDTIERKENNLARYLETRENSIQRLQNSYAVRSVLTKDFIESTNLAKTEIDEAAKRVANEVNNYILDHKEMTLKDLQGDSEFKKIAVQPLGIKGYTALTDYDLLTARFHVSESIVDLDLHTLAEKLPSFWSIMSKTEGGKPASGFYDWLESDGTLAKKYMYIDIVETKTADGVGLSVAATAYLDEFNNNFEISTETDEFFKDFLSVYDYENIHLISSFGDVWWESDDHGSADGNIVNINDIGEDSLKKTYFSVKDSSEVEFSDLIIDSDSGEIVSYISQPILSEDNSEKIGTIIVELNVNNLENVLNYEEAPWLTSYVYLTNNDGSIKWLKVPFNKGISVPEKINSDFLKSCFSDKENKHLTKNEINRFKNFSISDVLGSHRYIPKLNACLMIEVTAFDIFSDSIELIYYFILIFLALLIVVVFLIIIVSKYVTRPIKILESGIEIIETGKLDHKVGMDTNDEIGHLSRVFDRMTKRLIESREVVEKKVQDQTFEIDSKNKKLEFQNRLVLDALKNTKIEKNKINSIIENIGEGILVLENNKILMFNKKAEEISGYKISDAIDRKFYELLKFKKNEKDKYIAQSVNDLQDFLKDKKNLKNIVLKKKNNKYLKISYFVTPFPSMYNKIGGYVVVFRDVSREIEIDKMKTEFVSLASHQLLTPLTGIKWFIDLLLKGKAGKVNKKQKDFLSQVAISNERMIALVNDLLSVSHIETGVKFEIKKELVDISDIIHDSVLENIDLANKKKVTVSICPKTPKSLILNVDALKMRQVFNNLISNSIKYSKEGGKVLVGCGKKKNILFVRDNGVGIPEGQHNRVFQKFFRGDNIITKDTSGTGLGLYIAKGIIDAHGGKIWFESKENKGTTFYIAL